MAKCSAPVFNQPRKFQGFTFPAIFKTQEVGREGGGDKGEAFVIWEKGHLFFIFQKLPTQTAQLSLATSLCIMRKVPGVFINI